MEESASQSTAKSANSKHPPVSKLWMRRFSAAYGAFGNWESIDALIVHCDDHFEMEQGDLISLLGDRNIYLKIDASATTTESLADRLQKRLNLPLGPGNFSDETLSGAIFTRIEVLHRASRLVFVVVDTRSMDVSALRELVESAVGLGTKLVILKSKESHAPNLAIPSQISEFYTELLHDEPDKEKAQIKILPDYDSAFSSSDNKRSSWKKVGAFIIIGTAFLAGFIYLLIPVPNKNSTDTRTTPKAEANKPMELPLSVLTKSPPISKQSRPIEERPSLQQALPPKEDSAQSNSLDVSIALPNEGNGNAGSENQPYTIQLAVFSRTDLRDRYLDRKRDPQIRSTSRNSLHYIHYGEYGSRAQAMEAIGELPIEYSDSNPVVVRAFISQEAMR